MNRAFSHFGVRASPSSPSLSPRTKPANRNNDSTVNRRPAPRDHCVARPSSSKGYSCAIPRIAPHRECYATLQERRHVKRKEGDAVINLLVSVPEKVRLSLPVRILHLELGDELHFAAIEPCSAKTSAARPRQPFIHTSFAPHETSREERQSYCEREKTDLSMALYGFKQPSGQTTTPSSLR